MALSQLAAAWPASRTVPIGLGEIGAYSYTEGGQLMANASVLPFGGAQSLEVAYGAGINLIPNMYTAGRMEAFIRSLLFPIPDGRRDCGLWMGWWQPSDCGSQRKARWQLTQAFRRLGAAFTVERLHAAASRPLQWKRCQQRLVTSTKLARLLSTFSTSTTPLMRLLAEKGNNRTRTALANAFKAESGVLTVRQRSSGIPVGFPCVLCQEAQCRFR